MKKEYLRYLHLSHYIIMPLMGLLIVLARPLIEVILTPKWIDAAPYLQIFCLNFMLYPIIQQAGNPVAAIGHSGILLRYQFLKRGVSLAILIYTLTISIPAVCWGIVVSSLFESIVNVLICRNEIGVGIRAHINSQIDVFIATLVVCGLVYFVTTLISNALWQLIIGGVLGVVSYLIITWAFDIQEKKYFVRVIEVAKVRIGRG